MNKTTKTPESETLKAYIPLAKWTLPLTLGIATVIGTSHAAQAVTFNFSYGAGFSMEAQTAIQQVASLWSDKLYDNAVININVSFSALDSGVIGGARPGMIKVNYKDFTTALAQDSLSAMDTLAIQNLQLSSQDREIVNKYLAGEIDRDKVDLKTKQFAMLLDQTINAQSIGSGNAILDNNGNDNNQKIWLTRANAKALGLITASDKEYKNFDASIDFSNLVNWDFNRKDGINSNAFDFITVATHEIGHALGFISGVDATEFLAMSTSQNINDKDLDYVTPMDMYRFSKASAAQGVIDLRVGGGVDKYFSLDGGKTNLGAFATGSTEVGGDGYQASHWKDSANPLGIMNPSLEKGKSIQISNLDLTMLDGMGWDLSDRNAELMSQVGLDWNTFKTELDQRRQTIVAKVLQEKASLITDPEEIKSEAQELYDNLNYDIEKKVLKLKEDLAKETDPKKRVEKMLQTIKEIWDLAAKQDQKISELPKQISDRNKEVLDWLSKSPKDLAAKLETSSWKERQTLAQLFQKASASQRATWETKLLDALTIISATPSKDLEILLKNSAHQNPMGWGSGWGWRQTEAPSNTDVDLAVNPTSTSSKEVPEPSAIAGLVGLGALAMTQKKAKKS